MVCGILSFLLLKCRQWIGSVVVSVACIEAGVFVLVDMGPVLPHCLTCPIPNSITTGLHPTILYVLSLSVVNASLG